MDAKILTCVDITFAKEQLLSQIALKQCKIFDCDEFKVDDAKAVMREAYIAEEQTKYIIIVATSYRVEAQNALLKLLEEPPRNIVFILVAKSKTALLPTIRSRMQIENIFFEKEAFVLDLDISKMELLDIFNFLKSQKNISKHLLKETIEVILKQGVASNIALVERELVLFEEALMLAELNTRAQHILAPLLLMLYHARGRKQS